MTVRSRPDSGFALITALWAALILAIVVSSVVKTARTDARIAHTAVSHAGLLAVAQGAISIVELRLLGPRGTSSLPLDGVPITVAYAGHRVQVRIQDQAGLVDLNYASAEMITRLLHATGRLEISSAEVLTDRILDWRERGAGRRLNGAKAKDYAEAGYSYGPREGPFESLEELNLVMGVSQAIFERVSPALTVYSQKPLVFAEVAPEIVLAILPGMTARTAADVVADRARRRYSNDAPFGAQLPLSGRSLEITARVASLDETDALESATIRVTGFQAEAFWSYRTKL